MTISRPRQAPPRQLSSTAVHGVWRALLVLWLAGISLRITVLAVPPVLPAIHRDLHLNETLVAALTSLPILLLSLGAVAGSLLIARIGARPALLLGLCLIAGAGAARGLGMTAAALFAMTFVMGLGIAVSQPAMPTLVRSWATERVGLATAIYTNGSLIGEILAASLTGPLILPLVQGRWPLTFLIWSLPVAAAALGVLSMRTRTESEASSGPRRWWPDWGNPLTWRLGLIFGCASIGYFGANAFIPDYLKGANQAALITPALMTVNIGQLPASPIVAAFSHRLLGRPWPLVVAGSIIFVSGAGCFLGGIWIVVFGAFLGLGCGLVLVLTLALPPLLAPAHDVHRLSAGIFTISYACPFVGPLLGGAIWDLTGNSRLAFLPIVLAGLLLIALVLGLRFPREQGWATTG